MCSSTACVFSEGGWGPCEPHASAPIFGYIAGWLGSFAMSAFTLISGYLFCYIKCENGGYKKYLPFIINKVKRLLVPYVFISIVYVVPIHIYFFGVDDVINAFVLGEAPEHLWFLLMLFWVFVLFAPMADFIYKHSILGGTVICAFLCVSMVLPNFYQIATALRYSAFFYIGFFLYKNDLISGLLDKIPAVVYIVMDLILYALNIYISKDNGMMFKLLNIGLNLVLNIFGAVAAFIVLQKFVATYLAGNMFLSFLSKHSMTVYLVHQPIIFFTIELLNGAVSPVVIVMMSFILSLGLSIAFSLLISKTKITRFLVGHKCKSF